MDLFTTNFLTGVVNSLQVAPHFFLDKFFSTVQTETSEEIHFDQESDVMGLAPFVSPFVEGKWMSDLGYTTKTFKPAYIKPKNTWDPGRALKRYRGEPLTGAYSPEQRRQLAVADTLANHRKLIARRLEWMGVSVLRTGAVTISGDNYPTVSVSFGRDAALTVTLTGGAKWDQTGVDPLNDLQVWAELILDKSGSTATDVAMDIGAWKVFRANASVQTRLDKQRANVDKPTLMQDAMKQIGATYMGTLDGFNIWVYSGSYKDDSGTITKMLPTGTVVMCGDIAGVQAYGAILDEAAGIQALPYFSKSWVQEDPSRRFIMTQSAPLIVPYRPNASLCATVL